MEKPREKTHHIGRFAVSRHCHIVPNKCNLEKRQRKLACEISCPELRCLLHKWSDSPLQRHIAATAVHADAALTFTSHVCRIIVFLVFPRLIQQLVYAAFLESDLPASQSLRSSSSFTQAWL